MADMFGSSSSMQILLKMLSDRNANYTTTSEDRKANSTLRITLKDLKALRGLAPSATYSTRNQRGKPRPSGICAMSKENATFLVALVLVVILQQSLGVSLVSADISRTIEFKTDYGTSTYTETITITDLTLAQWRNLPHPLAALKLSEGGFSLDFSHYVDTHSIEKIAADVASVAVGGQEDVADTVLSFVQNVGYVWNDYTVGNTLYPIETLAGGGVCDDLSVLYASMMVSLGFRVIFLFYPNVTDLGGSPVNHVNVGVYLTNPPSHTTSGQYNYMAYQGFDYYIAETTTDQYLVGDLPTQLSEMTSYIEAAPLPTTTMASSQSLPSQVGTLAAADLRFYSFGDSNPTASSKRNIL